MISSVLLTRKTFIIIHISCKYDYDPHVYGGINYMYKKILTCIVQYIICVCIEYTYMFSFSFTNLKKLNVNLSSRVKSTNQDYGNHSDIIIITTLQKHYYYYYESRAKIRNI